MKKLSKNEWVAVAVSLFTVGFFFVFGQSLVSLFTNNSNSINMEQGKSQLIIKDEVIGTGEVAVAGNTIVAHYTGRFVDGKVFDSSVTRGEPIQFVLGAHQVIEGWDQGIQGMREGGKRLLSIPSDLAYGPNDRGIIPGGSTLIFEVELLKVIK